MNTLLPIAGILILATLTEAAVEYFIRPIVRREPKPIIPNSDHVDFPGLFLRYSAAGIGIALAVLYQADILALVGLVSPVPFVGYIVTGLVIGRGSNFVNDFAGRWLSSASL